jgi:hypothetical protein
MALNVPGRARVPEHEHAPEPEHAPGHVPDPEARSAAVPRVLGFAHDNAIQLNWDAFHVGVPAGFGSYVYRYRDGDRGLIYVGMTNNAAARATGDQGHYRRSDWWSWVMSAEYEWCRNRDEAFKLESKIRREELPTFVATSGYAQMIAELDREYMTNHVTGDCYCSKPSLTDAVLAGHPGVESGQLDTTITPSARCLVVSAARWWSRCSNVSTLQTTVS